MGDPGPDTHAGDESDSEWWGIVFPSAGQLRISELTISLTGGSATAEVRVDVWPQWLAIARLALDYAVDARSANPAANVQPAFGEALDRELLHSMTCICATAFTIEAFTSSVIHHQPQVLPPAPVAGSRNRGTSADGRIHQVWTRAFRLPNALASQIRTPLREIFRFRDQAVHPRVGFVEPARHAAFPASVHPRYAIFRVENALTAVQFTNDMLQFLLQHPRGTDGDWLAWCSFMTTHVWQQAEPPHTAPPSTG